jgi:PEGA domain
MAVTPDSSWAKRNRVFLSSDPSFIGSSRHSHGSGSSCALKAWPPPCSRRTSKFLARSEVSHESDLLYYPTSAPDRGLEASTMRQLILIVACGLALTGCAGYLPSFPTFGFFQSSPPTEQLRIESEPAGAEVKSSQGPTCRTPCELSVSSGSDFLVTVALNGYQTMTVPVRPDSPGGQLQPNPVFAELQPVVRPTPVKKPRSRKPNPGPNAQ